MPAASAKKSSGLLVLILLFQLFAFGLWIGGPRTNMERDCVFNVEFSKYVGHSINCDSSEFVYAAAKPSVVLEEESKRQARPGTILATYVMAQPLVFVMELLGADKDRVMTVRDSKEGGAVAFTARFNDFVAAYLMYLVLHLIILVACYRLYLALAGVDRKEQGHLKTVAALAGIAILANNITKQFLWSPHTQLFNILAPLLALYLFKHMLETDKPERFFILAALGSGFAMLFYGIFVLPITVAGLAFLWRKRDTIGDVPAMLKTLGTGILAIAIFFVPYVLWYGFIVSQNGAFYNYDVEYYGGFVWMQKIGEAVGWGKVAEVWLGQFGNMFKGAVLQGWGYMAGTAALVIYIRKKMPQSGAFREAQPLWVAAGIYALLAAIFFAFYGLTAPRLSFTITAALLPILGFYLHKIECGAAKPLMFRRFAVFAACGYIVFMLVKYGPYS